MSKSNALRRSRRLMAKCRVIQTNQTNSPYYSSKIPSSKSGIENRCQNNLRPKVLSSKVSSLDLEDLEAQLAQRSQYTQRKVDELRPSSRLLGDSASSFSHSTDDDEVGENTEFNELASISADNVECSTADEIDPSRHSSYDRRFEPGNEDYEYDGFVAKDDEDIEKWSEANGEWDNQRRISTITTHAQQSSSSEPKIFYSDSEDPVDLRAFSSWPDLEIYTGSLEPDLEPLILEERIYRGRDIGRCVTFLESLQ